MSKVYFNLKLYFSTTNSAFSSTIFSFTDLLIPSTIEEGTLKTFTFDQNGCNTDHTLFYTPFKRFKKSINTELLLEKNYFFFIQKNQTYFDCFKLEQTLTTNIIISKNKFTKNEPNIYHLLQSSNDIIKKYTISNNFIDSFSHNPNPSLKSYIDDKKTLCLSKNISYNTLWKIFFS